MQTLPNVSSCPESTSVDSGTISVFVTNLGKYNEGELVGEWLALPTTPEQVKQCFERIGIDGINYEEFFLTDYESSIAGITRYIDEYSCLNELNYLASQLDELSLYELLHYEAIVEMGDGISSLADLIHLTENLDCYDYLPNVGNEYDLGHYWIEDSGCYDLSQLGNLAYYLDYERFGRDVALEQGGVFTTHGYLYQTDNGVSINRDDVDIPGEYHLLP